MRLGTAVLFSLFVLAQGQQPTAQEWKKIVPLNTTRAEVQAMLGPANNGYEVLYLLKDGRLSIEYSSGLAQASAGEDGMCLRILSSVFTFHPLHPQRLSKLKLDPTKFRKVIDDEVRSFTYYINDEDGITYAIQQGKVDYVEYTPPKRYDHLYCKK